MTKIMVDSTCDLPEELLKKYDIKIFPLRVLIENKEYIDKVDIQVDEVYKAMRKGILPKTSQPNPKDIYNMFNEYCAKGEDFIFIAFSSVMSGTYQLAEAIMKEFKERYPHINMTVIDSQGGSTATGLIARNAAILAEQPGQTFENLVKNIEAMVESIEHVFTISDLNWMIKGGRISRAQGIIGNMMDIKPILDVNNGYMEVIKKVRGRKKALNTVVDILEQRTAGLTDQIIGISHADDLETAEELIKLIKSRVGCSNFIVNKIGSVLGSHLGIGGVGIFFFNGNVDRSLIR
ncbi:DegV family protein [Clostridium sp. 19966]|uniref:DegV family protein n=1 Tax=Clostridium sp. 19966 TaxID=2768166 RepID=UPI0028DD84F7|nr:DegV family protein [Clostridium sp. 19966]MDT8716943.1 DegV family protein [Clostridium sp. 19966]